jgi:GTP-binding protein LepA
MKSAQGTSLKVQEPVVEATVILPSDRLGTMLNLAAEYRAIALENTHLSSSRVMLRYDVPLAEMPSFTERTKQVTSGWASIDYQSSQGENGYRTADVDVLHILLNKERVDALASIVSVDRARERGRALCQRLKERLQGHAFEIRLQASYSNRIVASESIPAAKKDVTAKLYGGDFSRRKKLLDNQKEGQKKASRVGRVELEPGIFAEVLREDAVS